MKFAVACLTGFISVGAFAQFKNVQLAAVQEGKFAPVEPSITINYKDPNNIVAGICLNRVVYTTDAGITWTETELSSPFGVYGDPALISDVKGDLYYFHLADPSGAGRSNDAWLDRIVCQKSEDGGKTWSKGASIGNNPPKDQDKAWPAVHPRKQIIYTTWTQFDKYASKDEKCQSNILFSMSMNAGGKWTKPVRVNQLPGDCLDDDNTTEGATPAVSLDGKIYVTWSNKGVIFFDRSYDGGETWLTNDLAIEKQESGWSMDIPGISRCNGMPVLLVDNSPSRTHGGLYMLFADQKNGANDTDIYLMRSTTHGDNWTRPVKVNNDEPGKHQFLPWMAIDQTNGYVYIVYYDRREYDDLQTDVYLAYSFDGGNVFNEVKISEKPFIPTKDVFFGDYLNIAAHDGIIAPIWTRMDEGKTSVWTTIIREEDLRKAR